MRKQASTTFEKNFYKLMSNTIGKNTLTGRIDVTQEMYTRAVDMYHLFGCKNFGDDHDAYLQTDVFLLADVFELFRSVWIRVYR